MFPLITNYADVEHLVDPKYFSKITSACGGFFSVKYRKTVGVRLLKLFGHLSSKDLAKIHELRGIKFDAETGHILARPFHKFYNLGEHPADVAERGMYGHVVTLKLDGSMVHPIISNGELRLCTKGGITDVSVNAEKYMTMNVRSLCRAMRTEDVTPLFEFTGPSNRIVVDYTAHSIRLIGARYNRSGEYFPYKLLKMIGRDHKVPVVGEVISLTGLNQVSDLAAEVAGWPSGNEGVVVTDRNTGAPLFKIKANEYIRLHKLSDLTRNTKTLFKLVTLGQIDDILPKMSEAQRADVAEFISIQDELFDQHVKKVEDAYNSATNLTNKEIGLADHPFKVYIFNMRRDDYTNVRDYVTKVFQTSCEDMGSFKYVREFYDALRQEYLNRPNGGQTTNICDVVRAARERENLSTRKSN